MEPNENQALPTVAELGVALDSLLDDLLEARGLTRGELRTSSSVRKHHPEAAAALELAERAQKHNDAVGEDFKELGRALGAFAPGPWHVVNSHSHAAIMATQRLEAYQRGERATCANLAEVHTDGGEYQTTPESRSEGMANAYLMAAAPDLLAALEELVARRRVASVEGGRSLDGRDGRYLRARAAIAKARGEVGA